MSDAPLLDVRGLGISFLIGGGSVHATQDVSFSVQPGERVGIVGESGCGKTITGLSLLGLLPRATTHVAGQAMFEGENLVGLPLSRMRHVRGRKISMIFQEPMSALDPVFTIGQQIGETILTHFKVDKKQARERAIEALASVGIPSPARVHDSYPHQLSGGMRQRAMIAIALVCEPKLLIADEPTTALDVTIQAQIIDLLMELSAKQGTALLFITHDLGVIAETCTRMITMYAGQVVEDAPVDSALVRPRHPYTSGLLRSLPRLSARGAVLPSIAGRVPTLRDMPTGCRFAERCAHRQEACAAPQVIEPAGGHLVRCWRHGELVLPGALTDREAAA
ncbi:MAG: ABC transporter ATP-binding protein [Alphaproteobacteria bacterium]|nr:ABC transporter ATP-binding protein [Alphaproteobacteria bacterium]